MLYVSNICWEDSCREFVTRCWEGEVHLWDKAEALQWYIHRSKLHSANKEKTNNERKKPFDKITGSSGWPDSSGILKRLHCSPYT